MNLGLILIIFELFYKPLTTIHYFSDSICNRKEDSIKLVRFYYDLNGDAWINNWDLKKPIDTWYGVKLNEDGCLRSLFLPNNNLEGKIWDFSWPTLDSIDLSDNFIESFVNASGILSNLKYLKIKNSYTQYGMFVFNKFSNIKFIDLSNNEFTNSPVFGHPVLLQHLDLSHNQIKGSIKVIGNMLDLEYCNLSENELSELSDNIQIFDNLSKLKYINLSDNYIHDIPTFENNVLLDTIILHHCVLYGKIPIFEKLKSLKYLDLSENKLYDDIPNFNMSHDSISYLNLSNNYISFKNILTNLNENTGLIKKINYTN